MKYVSKILVIRLSSFGDIVLTFPFLYELRNLYPESKIDMVCKEQYSSLSKLHPFVNDVIIYNPDLKHKLSEINYDVVFDLQRNFNSRKIIPANAPLIRVYKETWKKHLLVYLKLNLLQDYIPVYKKYLNALRLFDVRTNLDYTTSALLVKESNLFNDKYIVVSPSSRHFTKRLPEDKFVKIFNDLEYRIILTGDNNDVDREICKNIEQHFDNCLNLCGMLSFAELTGVLKGAEFVVCNDSGILHLSEALGKKVFVFYGSTVKEFGFFPQLKSSEVFEVSKLNCRPCTHIGRSKCPKEHFKCMNDIDVNKVRLKIKEYTK